MTAPDHRARRRSGEGSWTWLAKKGLWRLRVTTEAGARVAYYAQTRAECERKAQLAAAQGGRRGEPGTVGDWLTAWAEDACRRVKPATCRRYQSAVTTHLVPALGRIRLDRLNAAHIQEATGAIAAKRFKDGRPISRATVRRTVDVLGNALEAAVKQGRLAVNPARALPPLRQEHREPTILTEDQANRLLDAASGSPFEALFTLALRCGLRQAELLGLQWRNVHLTGAKPTLDITGSLQRDYDGSLRKGEPKTLSARRTIALDNDSVAALAKLAAGRDDEYVFSHHGEPCTPQALIRQYFAPLLRQAGLPPMRFHDLRHTCATHLIEDGVSIFAVSHLLGHASIAVTQGIYGHLTPKQTDAATEAMNQRAARRREAVES